VIELKNVSFCYSGSVDFALKDIDIHIGRGEYVLVCGGSGSGKSTLAYLLAGLIPHFIDGELSGSVCYDGAETRSLKMADFLPRVGLVFQNSDAQLFNGSVEAEIAFGLESMGLSPGVVEERIIGAAKKLRIESLLGRSPTHLSGGEKRLVSIASVLALGPKLLVLDEPFSNLDWEGCARLKTILRELNKAGTAVVVVEQRLREIIKDVERSIVMEAGAVLFDGEPDQAKGAMKELRLLPRYRRRDMPGSPRKSSEVVSVKGLSYSRAGMEILRGVSLEIMEGEVVAVIGKNGAGKTTLIKHLNGLIRPQEGKVRIEGFAASGQSPLKMAGLVGVSFQNPNDQFFKNTVEEEIRVGLRLSGRDRPERLHEISILFGLEGLLERSPHLLSEGQKKRTAIASIFAVEPRVLVLDEPTTGQDGRFLEALEDIISRLAESGHTVIVVTHDLEFASAIADRWVMIEHGAVIKEGCGPEGIENEFFHQAA